REGRRRHLRGAGAGLRACDLHRVPGRRGPRLRAARRRGDPGGRAGAPLARRRRRGERRPGSGPRLGPGTRACPRGRRSGAGGWIALPSTHLMDREARSELLTMMGLVAIVVAVVILVFFAIGYAFGSLFL